MPAALAQMPLRSKILLGVSAFAVILVAFMLFRVASAPSYSTFMSGLDPAETGKMTVALDEKGIGYELQNNGTALAVEKSRFAEAQVALAESGTGAPSGDQPGYELLSDQKLGSSKKQEEITYQRALEGELGRTLDQIEGVNGVDVQLTLPEDELFADEETPKTAAVLLNGGATELDTGAVRGISSLVASSVQGLKAENVTITDGTGRMLWPTGEGGAGAGGMALASKTAAEARYASQKESQLNALLARTVGPGKAQVKVTADLDVDQVTEKQLEYGEKGVPLKKSADTEELESEGAGGGGATGTRANVPSYAGAGGGSGGESKYNKDNTSTEFGVDKTVRDIVRAPGTLNGQTVSVMIDPSLAPQKAQIQQAIETAAGVEQGRDSISVTELPFAKPEAEPKASAIPAGAVGYAKYAALGLASLLFLFFVTRALRRREGDALMDEPLWLRHIEQPKPISALEAPEPEIMVSAARHEVDQRRATVEELIKKEPEKVANQVRAWVTEED
jgi:flagellar M-ring protein FliF